MNGPVKEHWNSLIMTAISDLHAIKHDTLKSSPGELK